MTAEPAPPPSGAGDREILAACLQEVSADLLRDEAHLSTLDRAIGDGDHGSNVARAAHALLDAQAELLDLPIGQALEKAGLIIVMSVGGASGPLYGSLLMAMGKAWCEPPRTGTHAEALIEGVEAVGRRGRSTIGEKTMLDVLEPAARALHASADAPLEARLAAMCEAADTGLEATRPLKATKGRAAYVGERSVGHLDPGAASACLCIHAAARAIRQVAALRTASAR